LSGKRYNQGITQKEKLMRNPLLHWILSALAIWVVSQIVPGFVVNGAVAALIAALVIGFVNGTVGFVIKFLTLPLAILTLGLIWLFVNALMIMLAAQFIPGFEVQTFAAAFWGAIVLSIVNMILRALVD
jgi:putative membrane protein